MPRARLKEIGDPKPEVNTHTIELKNAGYLPDAHVLKSIIDWQTESSIMEDVSVEYRIEFVRDDEKKRITIRPTGPLTSAIYIDDCIAFFKSIEAPWTYQRLVDFRSSTGTVKFEDIMRLSNYWAQTPQRFNPVKTATILRSSEEANRDASMKLLLDSEYLATFLNENDAVRWLEET